MTKAIQRSAAPVVALSIDASAVTAAIEGRARQVVRRAGRMAFATARELVPVRKVFAVSLRNNRSGTEPTGGRRSGPRIMSASEAKMQLPAFLRSTGRSPSVRAKAGQITNQQGIAQLRSTPIQSGRNRANGWQRTGQIRHPVSATLQGPAKSKAYGVGFQMPITVQATQRDVQQVKAENGNGIENRLVGRQFEDYLSVRGRYELKKGRALSVPLGRKTAGRFGRAIDVERMKQSDEDETTTLGGALKRSLELVERENTATRIKVSIVAGGEDAPYARFVEFGTRHAPAQPFLRPALKNVEGPFKAMMREAFPGR